MSLYIEGSPDAVMSSAMSQVDLSMQSGELLYAHESLRKLTFKGSVEYIVADDEVSGTDDIDDGDTGEDAVWTPGYVSAIAIGAAALFSSILLSRALIRVPREYDTDDEEFDSANFREISNNTSLGVSSDDRTVHASNKEIDVDFDNRGLEDLANLGAVRPDPGPDPINTMDNTFGDPMDDDYYDDTMDVNIDLESYEPRSRAERDGCFDFFDLVLEGTGTTGRRQNIIDQDERSHISEISF